MNKKYQLTLIELLISMAIFTVMISLLVKSFQLATDISSSSESTIKSLEKSQLSLNLLSSELKQALSRNSMSWVTIPGAEYQKFDKSLSFYIDDESIRFFMPSEEANMIYAVQYRYNTDENSSSGDKKGLVRYEKKLNADFESRRDDYNNINGWIADKNNLIAHVGLTDRSNLNSDHRLPPDLYTDFSSDGSRTSDVVIAEESIEALTISYSLIRYDYDDNNTGADDDPALKKGEQPDYITINMTLKDANNAGAFRNFSRKISLNGN